MKNACLLLLLPLIIILGAMPNDKPPEANITNDIINARLYLPDTAQGYYRATRFDWSGVIASLECNGHSYFGQWFARYSPTSHDAIMGPVEDFWPLGYDSTKDDGTFIKIGVGVLAKPKEPRYSFTTLYKILNTGKWKVKTKKDAVQFEHKLQDEAYAYTYKKTVQLVKGQSRLVLSHSLKNTGKLPIQTNVYNHNFFVIDSQPTGPDFEVKFNFALSGQALGREVPGGLNGQQIAFSKVLTRNDHLHYPALSGFGNTNKDYDIRIENSKTGAAVRITSDQPLAKLVFWSAPATLCPEPYMAIDVKPGEVFRWNIYYDFYTTDPKNKQGK